MKPSLLSFLFLCALTCCAQPGTDAPAEPKSIVVELKENGNLPIEEQVALYRRLKKDQPQAYNFENEDELTMYGYNFLWQEQTDNALEIFKLIRDEFPNSANAYDSVGEAYLVLGDEKRALANYQKAFAMNPDNFYAEDIINRILNPDDVPLEDKEKFAVTYSAEAYRADLDQLAARLLKVHPNALKFITAEDFQALIERKKALVTDQMTYAEFRWHCAEIIASLNCSHTSMGRFSTESEMLPVDRWFPVPVRLIDGKLYVVDPMENADQLAEKDEILTINGTSVAALIRLIYPRIPSQGYVETTKRHAVNTWGTGMIPYALGFPEVYTVTVKGQTSPVTLHPVQETKNHFRFPTPPNGENELFYDVQEDGETAILTITSFNFYPWNNLDVFIKFMDETFAKIKDQGIEHLIIDVRYNGGGSMESSIYLLRHLIPEAFAYTSRIELGGKSTAQHPHPVHQPLPNSYRGKLYFLIDGLGNSTTGHFMSHVKVRELGAIIGEELGSNQFCSAGQEVCRLSNTRLMYYVANNTHVTTATSLPDETGILPDHYVTQGIDDFLEGVDTVKEFALKLAKKGR